MVDVNELLDLAGVPLSARAHPDLEAELSRVSSAVAPLLAQASPDIVNEVHRIRRSPLFHTLQPTGALERIAWIVVHQGAGADRSPTLLEEILTHLLRASVLVFALSISGGRRGLAHGSAEATAATQDSLARLTSRSMQFMWISRAMCLTMAEIISADEAWVRDLPAVTPDEIDGLIQWCGANLTVANPQPLAEGELGYALGLEISRLHPVKASGIRGLLQERDMLASPLRLTKGGLLLATPRLLPTKLYLCILDLAEETWTRNPRKKGIRPRGKGELFEQTIQRLLSSTLGHSRLPEGPFSISLASGKATDVDCCWIGTGWLVGECKSYAPSSEPDDAHTKISNELAKIASQLEERMEALTSGNPVRTTSGEASYTLGEPLIRVGIVVDDAHILSCRQDRFGDIHIFTAEGLLAALGALGSFIGFGDYVAFRRQALSGRVINDECDVLIAFLQSTVLAPRRLPDPRYAYVQPSNNLEWQEFLRKFPERVEGASY